MEIERNDEPKIDSVARELATPTPRRRFLTLAAALFGGGTLSAVLSEDAAAGGKSKRSKAAAKRRSKAAKRRSKGDKPGDTGGGNDEEKKCTICHCPEGHGGGKCKTLTIGCPAATNGHLDNEDGQHEFDYDGACKPCDEFIDKCPPVDLCEGKTCDCSECDKETGRCVIPNRDCPVICVEIGEPCGPYADDAECCEGLTCGDGYPAVCECATNNTCPADAECGYVENCGVKTSCGEGCGAYADCVDFKCVEQCKTGGSCDPTAYAVGDCCPGEVCIARDAYYPSNGTCVPSPS